MALDSAASFAARVIDLGLASLLGRFQELGWTNLGTLASSAGTPGAPSAEAAFEERVIIPLCGSSATSQAAAIRRLYFEATTLAAADMRRRMDRVDDDTIPPVPTEEREARRARLQARVIGVGISGDLDPSPSLVHAAHTMTVSGTVKYVPWETCTKFSQEAYLQTKKRQGWAPDASGVIKEHSTTELPTANLNTTHLLSQALLRRGLAFEIGMIMTFEVHEVVRRSLLDALCEEPPRCTPRPVWPNWSARTSTCSRSWPNIPGPAYGDRSLRDSPWMDTSRKSWTRPSTTCSSCRWQSLALRRPPGATGSEPPAKKAARPDRQAATIENLKRQVENLKRKPENQGGGAKRQKDAKGRSQKGQDQGGPCRQN